MVCAQVQFRSEPENRGSSSGFFSPQKLPDFDRRVGPKLRSFDCSFFFENSKLRLMASKNSKFKMMMVKSIIMFDPNKTATSKIMISHIKNLIFVVK